MRALLRSAFTLLFIVLLGGVAQAGGLYLTTYGTPDMARASAGAGAKASDASTAFHNPAGMTRLDDHAFTGSLAPGFTRIHFDVDEAKVGGGDGGQQGGFVPIVGGQYVHKISDRWRFGFSMNSISGAVLNPDDDWAGRNEVTELSLLTLGFFPSIGVRVTDWLSLGVGGIVSFGKLKLKLKLPTPREPDVKLSDMNDWTGAPVASVLVTPLEGLRLSMAYQGKLNFKLDGKVSTSLSGNKRDLRLGLPLAQAVRFGVYWETTEDIRLSLSTGWEDWSVAETLPIDTGVGSTDIPLNMRDTWYLGAGIEWDPCADWTVETGFRYDSSALDDSDRTTSFPIDRVFTLGVGTRWDWTENTELALNFVWTNLGEGRVNTPNVRGKYRSNDLYLFGVHVNFKKLPWAGRLTL
jgi:long-chain fatty acid transport protein